MGGRLTCILSSVETPSSVLFSYMLIVANYSFIVKRRLRLYFD